MVFFKGNYCDLHILMAFILYRVWLIFFFLMFSGCQSFKTFSEDGKDKIKEIPRDGLLGAKLAALEYAMDNLPEEDRKFGDLDYVAYGIADSDSLHRKAMVAILKGRTPTVVDSSKFYSRSSNSQWMKGRPAIKWIIEASKDPQHPLRVDVMVGWMHSQIINEFATYKIEYDGVVWTILNVAIMDLESAP
jgi:hypothetical protein